MFGDSGSVLCVGDLNNFSSVLSPAFRAATVFVGLSVIVIVLCVVAFLLFLPMRSDSVFEICGTMQFLSGKTTTTTDNLGRRGSNRTLACRSPQKCPKVGVSIEYIGWDIVSLGWWAELQLRLPAQIISGTVAISRKLLM